MSIQEDPEVESEATILKDLDNILSMSRASENIFNGNITPKLIEEYKKTLLDLKIITRLQSIRLRVNRYLIAYNQLREGLSKDILNKIQENLKELYTQISKIKSTDVPDIQKASSIQKLLNDANLCRYIRGTKEELLEHAISLKLSVTSNSTKAAICYVLLDSIIADVDYTLYKVVEKEYFNPDKRGLPNELSDLTPQEIATRLRDDIKTISGPIYGALLVPKEEFTRILGRNPPVFMLLGDCHTGNERCNDCPKEGCYSLYNDGNPTFLKYLSTLAKDSNVSIDLFLENWIPTKIRNENNLFLRNSNSAQDSALTESSRLMAPCVGQRKEKDLCQACFFTEFRTHSANPRHGFIDDVSNKYIADTILFFLYESMKTNTEAILLTNFPDFNVYEELLSLYSAKDNLESIILYFNSPFFKKYSRTLHEFYQLPKDVQVELMERVIIAAETDKKERYMISSNPSIRKFTMDTLKHYISSPSNYNKQKILIVMKLAKDSFDLSLGVTLVDIYTISRALKGFSGGLPSQLSVVYQGNEHIQREMLLLDNYYDVLQTWGTFDYQNIKKCITVNN